MVVVVALIEFAVGTIVDLAVLAFRIVFAILKLLFELAGLITVLLGRLYKRRRMPVPSDVAAKNRGGTMTESSGSA